VRRGLTFCTLPLFCCLNDLCSAPLTSLRSCFRNHFILYPTCSNALISMVLFSHILWNVQFTKPNSRHISASFFPLFIYRITLTFISVFRTFLFFVILAMLSCYQYPVNCSNRKVENNFKRKMIYRYYSHFQGLEFNLFIYAMECEICLLKDDEVIKLSKLPTSWKVILEWMNGNVVISEIGATACVVLSKAEDHVTYEESIGTTECITIYPRCRTNLGRYNGVKLC